MLKQVGLGHFRIIQKGDRGIERGRGRDAPGVPVFRFFPGLARIPPIPRLHRRLEDLGSLPHVGDVRTIGMVGALEIVKDKKTREPFPAEDRIGLRLFEAGLKRNLILRPMGNVTYLFLPLSTTEADLADILDRFSETITQTKL